MIGFFINEASIHSQFKQHTFEIYFNAFLDQLDDIRKLKEPYEILISKSFYLKEAIEGENLIKTIKSNRDLNLRYVSIFHSLKFKFWEEEKIHSSEVRYIHQDQDYVDTTIAEGCEVSYLKEREPSVAFNLPESIFTPYKIIPIMRIEGQNQTEILLSTSVSVSDLKAWVIQNNISLPFLRKFEHNPKHHQNTLEKGKISKLECSHENAQDLLNNAISESDFMSKKLYNYDTSVKKYIVFRKHGADKFHGYHVDDINEIPFSIRKKIVEA